jgi:peptidyl-prolyl cis-trans isomerase D
MISSMRSMAPKIMLLVLLAFLGTIFLDWGMNRGSSSSRMTNAGKIDGRDIPLSYFDQAVNQQRQQIERGTPEQQEQSRLIPQQVWEQEIQKVLLGDVIKKLYLFSSVDEVFDFLKHNPIGGVDTAAQFKTNGVFDTNKYVALLNDPRTYENNPGLVQFERNYREFVLPVQKLETLLSAVCAPTKAELEYLYKTQSDKTVFEYAYLKSDGSTIDSSKVTPDMVSRYYTAHKDTFKCDNQAEVYFVRVSKMPTHNDEMVLYREMLAAKNKIMGSKNKLDDFVEENNIWNDDEKTSTNGGDLGWVTPGTMGPEFDSTAFKLDTGMVSDPIKTNIGYELVFVEKKENDGKTVKIMARRIVRKVTANIDSLSEKTDSLRRLMADIGFVKAAIEASKNNPIVQFDSTGFFEKNNLLPGLGYLPGLGRFVWGSESKEKDAVSERLENKDGYYLLAIKQRMPKGTYPLEVAKPIIIETLTDSIRKAELHIRAEALLNKIGESTPLATLKETDMSGIGSGITDTVTQMSYIPDIGQNTPVTALALALPVGKRSGLVEFNRRYYIVRPLWKGPETAVPWESPMIAQITGQVMNQTKGKIFEKWYLDLKKRMKIVSNIDKIYLD